MPVYCNVGGLGSGKTLLMTVYGYLLHTLSGLPVYTNYSVDFGQRIKTFQQLFALEDGIVLIDEMQVIIDSRAFSSQYTRAMTQWILQSRKAGLIVIGTTQRLHQVDKRFRHIFDMVFQCRKVGAFGDFRSHIVAYDPIGEDVLLRRGSRVLRHQQWMYQLYNTKERVNLLE